MNRRGAPRIVLRPTATTTMGAGVGGRPDDSVLRIDAQPLRRTARGKRGRNLRNRRRRRARRGAWCWGRGGRRPTRGSSGGVVGVSNPRLAWGSGGNTNADADSSAATPTRSAAAAAPSAFGSRAGMCVGMRVLVVGRLSVSMRCGGAGRVVIVCSELAL